MDAIIWAASIAAGAICLGAGVLGWIKSPKSSARRIFLLAMISMFVAMATSGVYSQIGESETALERIMVKSFVMSLVLAMTLLWELTIVFPVERDVTFAPPNRLGIVMVAAVVASAIVGLRAEATYDGTSSPSLSAETAFELILVSIGMLCIATAMVSISRSRVSEVGRRSSLVYLVGLWILAASSALYTVSGATDRLGSIDHGFISNTFLIAGVGISGFLFAIAIAEGQMVMFSPVTEKLVSSSKAKYKLLHRRTYLVLESKADFSVKMFADILKGRCFDCEDDESFSCESLDCSNCGLPCPCRSCTKYSTRPQGLIVTRQLPRDLRAKYFIQTTPIIWLSSVSGKDNMDPAKLSMLSDFIMSFMEKSPNSVVLVDGIEYLVTTNDFPRTLKSIDRWTETAMTSSSRLIITVDSKSFDGKELALLERNREVVRPDARETWRVIPERI